MKAEQKQDEKEFEKWWKKEFPYCLSNAGAAPWARLAWLESRKLLREEGKE